jgi:hypothetical protein
LTWRAFAIGILGVVGLCLLTPVNDYAVGNTFLTGNHFPAGVFFFLFVLVFVLNVLIKLVRRAWALRRAELMLICSMMLVSATVPASGLMRYWFPMTAAAPYLAQRPDVYWEEDVLKEVPDGIVVSKDPRSAVARKFYEGTPRGEVVYVPWGAWAGVFATWGAYIAFYYLATLLLCGLLRRHWVENERLIFPLARVPLELTEGAGGPRLVPPIVLSKPFLLGVAASAAFGLIRLLPVFFGAETAWKPVVPVGSVLQGTALARMQMSEGPVYPVCIGFAFLVPSDVSLSIWLFYIVISFETFLAHSFGRPFESGIWGPFISWQRSGAIVVFSVGMLWAARRHLWTVVRTACARGGGAAGQGEPVGYRLGFWGLVLALAGMVGWFVYFGMNVLTAAAMVFLIMCAVLVHMRLIAQGGLYMTGGALHPPVLLHSLTGGHGFSAPAAVVANMQQEIFHDAREWLGPHAMNVMRISSVFERRRRLLLPALIVALLVALVASGYSTLRWVHYDLGTLNSQDFLHSGRRVPLRTYNRAHEMIATPARSARPQYLAISMGAVGMAALMALRGVFYWWPVHPLGLALATPWPMMELWFCFMLGWLTKVCILKFGTGGVLRGARTFFVGVIVTETTIVGLTTLVSLLTGVRIGQVFLSG